MIYCRVSTKDQLENFSLETQERVCREYCKREKLLVLKVFAEAESAKSVNRPQFQAMLSYCGTHRDDISSVVVYAVSRFARNALDHLETRKRLQEYGIALKSATEAIDQTPTGKFSERVIAALAEWDNDLRAQRTKDGMMAAIMSGKWVHKPPIGYLGVPEAKGSMPNLRPDPIRAPIIRTAYELIASGKTKAEVLRTITAMGLTTQDGRPLLPQSLEKILGNPVYAGRIVIPRWGSWGIDHPGAFEALVSPDLFERVQGVLDGKGGQGIPHVRESQDFPLRVFAKCEACGKGMTGSFSTGRRGKRYPYYLPHERL